MIPELKNLEPQLKQILYGCVEHVQATKAALYLSSSLDLSAKTYELVTHYRFTDDERRVVRASDDLVDRLAVKRGPFFVNGLGADQRFSEMLFRQGTDRLLATPLFSRGRLVGFIDMRDKAGRKPFESNDVEAARRIADDVLALLGSRNLFGIGPIALVEDVPQRVSVMPSPQPAIVARANEASPGATRAITAAREFLSKRQHTAAASAGRRAASDRDADLLRLLLPSALAIPGASIVCLSAAGSMTNPQAVASLAQIADDAMAIVEQHLQAWLKRANQPHMTTRRAPMLPFGAQPIAVAATAISTIVSAPVSPHAIDGLLLTIAFERTPEANAQRAMQWFLKQIEPAVDAALAASAARIDKQTIAEKLLEPDFQRYPELAEHCRAVAAIAHRFAVVCELPPQQVETVRIAALVHDAGMRLLDYDRLYKRAGLPQDDLRLVHEHPVIGAALIEPLLGSEIAQAVLRHHERVDGKGYPSRLGGQQIPLAARILQIADAWAAMTSQHSYQIPVSREEAAAKLGEAAGTQFDEPLVTRFLKSLGEIVQR
jgi:response regulator RpfG family c-di-GMP phosphodiesterase